MKVMIKIIIIIVYVVSSKSSGYFKYKVNSSAPNTAVLRPVAIVSDSGSPNPKLKNAILQVE